MKIKKVLLVSILLFFTITFLTSCAKLVSEECIDVEATITDAYHRPVYVTPITTGKTMMLVTHPAVYRVTVEYEGVEYSISDSSFYDEHKDRIGESVEVVCHKRYYDDGSIRQYIEAPDNY